MTPTAHGVDELSLSGLSVAEVLTLEAFADTIVPGVKRYPEDRSIAGVSDDGGAVAAGALELLESAAGGLGPWLGDLASMLNAHAGRYAESCGVPLDESVPEFVSLSYELRTGLILQLTGPDHPERQGWVNLVMFSNMAFDTAAHLHTVDAIAQGHPGLTLLGFAKPDDDGLWRFPDYSYRRELAERHPATTPSGSPR
jgi:hypothetical protein